MGEVGELGDVGLGDEAPLLEVAAVDLQDQGRAGGEGAAVVREVGPVGRADLEELDTGPLHHCRDAKGPADLDQLAPGHDDGPAHREGVQRQQQGGRIVVDDMGRLGPGEQRELGGEPAQARAATTGLEVELEARVALCGPGDSGPGRGGERGAAQVGVQQDAGGVQDPSRMGRGQPAGFEGDPDGQVLENRRRPRRGPRRHGIGCSRPVFTERLEHLPGRRADRPERQLGGRGCDGLAQAVDRRQPAARIRVDGPLQIHDSGPQIL